MAMDLCPVWIGHLLLSSLRRRYQDPKKILGAYVKPGMTAIDVGCAMGYFSLPLAELVETSGRAVCLDVQEKMLKKLRDRAQAAGVGPQLETRHCRNGSYGVDDLTEKVDFVLAFAMVHETPDPDGLFTAMVATLKPGGKMLVSEPRGHVGEAAFEKTVRLAVAKGLVEVERPTIRIMRSVVLQKPAKG